MKLTVEDIVAEFNRPVLVNEHGCWLWMGATDNRGYARIGGNVVVHGVTWRMAGFTCIGDDAELCHTCPNHNCINPDHLYVGTHKENMNDDNRQKMGPDGRLTPTQIEELDQMLFDGVYSKGEIADRFGVSPQWISKFLRGEFKYAKPCKSSI